MGLSRKLDVPPCQELVVLRLLLGEALSMPEVLLKRVLNGDIMPTVRCPGVAYQTSPQFIARHRACAAVQEWAVSQKKTATYVQKGECVLTEHYR